MDQTTITSRHTSEQLKLPRKLYTSFYAYALKIAFRYLHDYESATAATNATFAHIFKNTPYLEFSRDEHTFRNFITRRTVFTILELYDRVVKNQLIDVRADQIIRQALSPVDIDARLIYHLGLLSPWHRTLFNMHVIDGFQLVEIAQHFRLPRSTCASQLQEAKTLLKKLLSNDPQLR